MAAVAEPDFLVLGPKFITIPEGREPRPEVVAALKESIARVGVINPLTLTRDHRLVAGRNRLQAALELDLEIVPCMILPEGAPETEITVDENVVRLHATADQLREFIRWGKEQAVKLVAIGKTVREAAREVGLSKSSVARAASNLSQAGQIRRQEQVRALRDQGKSFRAIAAEVGVSPQTAANDAKAEPRQPPQPTPVNESPPRLDRPKLDRARRVLRLIADLTDEEWDYVHSSLKLSGRLS